jgi:hypothetical protein
MPKGGKDLGRMDHALETTQHWASDGEHAIIVECGTCGGQTFVGYGMNAPEAEKAADVEHDDWVAAGSPASTPQGVELLYRRFGFSSGRGSRPGAVDS